MKIIYNNIIPFPGYKAINLFGIVFARRAMDSVDMNHEAIHTAQMKELLYIPYYIWYLIEWMILIIKYGNSSDAYYNIRFEKEAYEHEFDMDYLKNRKHYHYE